MKRVCIGGTKYTAQEFVEIGNRDCEEEPSGLASWAGNAVLAFLRNRRDRIGTEVRIMSITDARRLSIDVEAIIEATMTRHEEETKKTDEDGCASELEAIQLRKARAELRFLELKIKVYEGELSGGKEPTEAEEQDAEENPTFDELLDRHFYQIKGLLERARREAPSSEPWWL